MELTIYNIKGEATSRKVSLNDDVFAITPNEHAIYLDVKSILANRRQGTHKAKERAEVSFSTRKLKRQKGTGGARAGSIKSPVFVGGGTIFGPRPRDYSFKLNKKVKVLARKSALSMQASENNVIAVESIVFDKPSTKQFNAVLKALKADSKKTLLVLPESNKNVYLSARNIEKMNVSLASELNTFDILNASKILLVEGSESVIETILNRDNKS
jgi:large subunit ribosomal protein L4